MNTTQLLVQRILETADRFEWTLQGFGMLRMYLSKEVRLHIWLNGFAVPNVSRIHDHPWDFESEIVCGQIRKLVYGRSQAGEPTFTEARILCGTGGHLIAGSEKPARLVIDRGLSGTYNPGNRYREVAEALHETIPKNGTVTIVTRKFKQDTEHATVCYPIGTPWVSAEPRPATKYEIDGFAATALQVLRGT